VKELKGFTRFSSAKLRKSVFHRGFNLYEDVMFKNKIGSSATNRLLSLRFCIPHWNYYRLTLYSRVLLGKLRDPQLVKKFCALFGNQKFIDAFTTAPIDRDLILSQMNPAHALLSCYLKTHFNIILNATLAL
jgi:hypothetical protein